MASRLKLSSGNTTGDSGLRRAARLLSVLLKILVSVWVVAVCPCALAQTVTRTLLNVTSHGSAVVTVSTGSIVTLTASVQAGSAGVGHGQVRFCDATVAYCSDIHLLGAAQLTSAGKAKLSLRPGPGAYSYKAEFLGTPKSAVPYAGSVSALATLKVTGSFPSATTIAQSGSPGNYTLATSVYGFTKSKSAQSPTGTISFLDTTTGESVLKTATLASAGSEPVWVNVANPALGNEPGPVVAGDFNGDGNLDLGAALNSVTNTVGIFLGDGKGNLTQVTSNPITATGSPVLVQDFNGDGIPDLLLSDQFGNSLTVLLGNGDGTFTEAKGSPITTGYGSFPVVTADLNGDGIPDLVVAGGYYLAVLLGNGDGTFTQMPITSSTITNADLFSSMAVGDFNGDGIPDLATIDLSDETVSIFLGNGDGTFRQGSTITVSPTAAGSPVNLTAADFNGDGSLDLAVPIYGSSGSVVILLGNGDGTFRAAPGSPVAVGAWPNRVAVGDFNGDGIPDLFAGAMTSGTDIFILLGKGDGTFTPASTGSTRLPCCSSTVLGDFNGDGVTDLVSSDFYDGIAQVLLTALKQSVAATTGVSVAGQSPQQVVARYPGDSSYTPSESNSTSLLVQAAAPVFTPAPGLLLTSQLISLASATPGATIYYSASGALQTSGFVPYTGPIAVSSAGSLAMQAYAVSNNYGQSAKSSATYRVVLSTGLTITPNPLAFGSDPVRTSATRSITIKGATTYSSVTLTRDTTDFALATNTCTGAVTAVCEIGVKFDPLTTGGKVATIVVKDSDKTSPQLIGVTGSGGSYESFMPASVAFAAQLVNTNSKATTITFKYTGTESLTLNSLTPTAGFTVNTTGISTGACNLSGATTIASDGTCLFNVVFNPGTTVGTVKGTITAEFNADPHGNRSQVLALTGTGTSVSLSPATLAFGTVTAGTKDETLTISNKGTATLTFNRAPTITGTASVQFTVTGGTCLSGSVVGHSTCTYIVKFTSTGGAATFTSYLNITDSDPTSPQKEEITAKD